jgi:hypothetical protein
MKSLRPVAVLRVARLTALSVETNSLGRNSYLERAMAQLGSSRKVDTHRRTRELLPSYPAG